MRIMCRSKAHQWWIIFRKKEKNNNRYPACKEHREKVSLGSLSAVILTEILGTRLMAQVSRVIRGAPWRNRTHFLRGPSGGNGVTLPAITWRLETSGWKPVQSANRQTQRAWWAVPMPPHCDTFQSIGRPWEWGRLRFLGDSNKKKKKKNKRKELGTC